MSAFGYVKKGKPANWIGVAGARPVATMKKEIWESRPMKPVRKRIKPKSPKKAKSDRLYNTLVKEWLARPENRIDRVKFVLTGQRTPSTCNHHIRGRFRTLKFDVRYFCPASSYTHLWPHENIEAGRRLGLIAAAGEWNVEPDDAETKRLEVWMEEQGIL